VTIGEGTRIWHFSHILGKVSIGRDYWVGQKVVISPCVKVGAKVKIRTMSPSTRASFSRMCVVRALVRLY
jgi:UDP-3-O-[3-hydroxymyristoyl] glucosamine N-acyltransferase